ncbi:hypothetical protein I5677_05680 [Mobilitalea sibirica]|uniref:Uncharacterized protein n=1 Tax=Mobilitalea sibirica TaxID=1462919 RepID=A0A8J7KSK4_9FIRM|nr:hypothetical protein [Mobilitalea sibirica]MBH1940386.1 hypothetical protein [Mobilitalea sibirica]
MNQRIVFFALVLQNIPKDTDSKMLLCFVLADTKSFGFLGASEWLPTFIKVVYYLFKLSGG